MCIRYRVELYSTKAKIMHDAMDKCSMTRAHGMVNKELCNTFAVVWLNCNRVP